MKRGQMNSSRLLWTAVAALGVIGAAGLGFTPDAGSAAREASTGLEDKDTFCAFVGDDDGKDHRGIGPTGYARSFSGLINCLACHRKGTEGEVELPLGLKMPLDKEQWVTYREYPAWMEKDKHAQAFAVLWNERSTRMGKILKTIPHRDKRCLACHTGFPVDQMPMDDGKDKKVESKYLVSSEIIDNQDVLFGVTCEGCHGPAQDQGKFKGWMDPHTKPPKLPYGEKTWRFMSPEKKWGEYGFWDVRSPVSRAKICASCHIGDVNHGRVVTHEMYAAGHPPLPAFEIETFISQMGYHWKPFEEKDKKVKEHFLKHTNDPLYKDGAYKDENLHHTRALLLGALVSTAEYLRLVSDLAGEKGKDKVDYLDTGWPEYAVFDCYACHHELKSDAWRQARKPRAGAPGRPYLQEGNLTLVKMALDYVGVSQKEYDEKFDPIHQALQKQAFGKPADLMKSTRATSDWLYGLAKKLELTQVTPDKGPKLLKDVVDRVVKGDLVDYEAGRQYTWALEVLAEEMKLPGGREGVQKTINPDGKLFLLNLRSKEKKEEATLPGFKEKIKFLEVELESVLPYVANYDPRIFRNRVLEIGKGLKE